MKRLPAHNPEGQTLLASQTRLIGEALVSAGLITDNQLEEALSRQASSTHTPLGQVLVEMRVITDRQVVMTLADAMNVPFMNVTPEQVQHEALRLIDARHLDEHNLLPLSVSDGWLTIAVEYFTDTYLIDDIRRWSGLEVIVVAADPEAIRRTRGAVQEDMGHDHQSVQPTSTDELDRVIEQLHIDNLDLVENIEIDHKDDELTSEAGSSPVITLVSCIIQDAVRTGASDIHIEPVSSGCRVRYRVDGELREQVRFSARLLAPVVSRIKILGGLDISERRLPQDGGISVSVADNPIDLRVSTMPAKFGEKIVMRVVDQNRFSPDLGQIGMEAGTLAQFRRLTSEAHGIVIITGPTGSGKTTTLYGALHEIVGVKRNISTIEDPVERRLDGANQFQVNNAADFTFARALRAMLRQDPDVMMVGEVRDTETAQLATEAALTGHLVLTTLHTNDALSAIPRLINMGVEPYLVAASVRGVLAQRLVKRLCPDCREPMPLPEDTRQILARMCGGTCPVQTVYTAEGCDNCLNTGTRGRVGVFELVTLSESMLSEAICSPRPTPLGDHPALRDRRTLLTDGLNKVADGQIGVHALLNIVSRVEQPFRCAGDDEQAAARSAVGGRD